jgi:nucleotide-binding universal stress UspA family protein
VGSPSGLFDRIVCGIDRSAEGLVAAAAAGHLAAPEGSVALVAVDDPGHVELRPELEAALERARRAVAGPPAAESVLLTGRPVDGLLAEIERRRATLAVVGSHGHSRPVGIVLGSVATMLLHEARCSTLVARASQDPDGWPRSIVVGLDGSPESVLALHAAEELRNRFGSHVRTVAALRHGHPDLAAARRLAPELEEHDLSAVSALAVLSEETDLVVVGSRGLRGVRALGSVSERVAHEARCSVLVVRSR